MEGASAERRLPAAMQNPTRISILGFQPLILDL